MQNVLSHYEYIYSQPFFNQFEICNIENDKVYKRESCNEKIDNAKKF